MENKIKIGVCFSGQLRTGIENQERLKTFFGELYPYCDFFMHTWNINTQKNTKGLTKVEKESVSIEQVETYKKIFNIKKINFEDYDETFNNNYIGDVNNKVFLNIIQPLWYSFKKSVDLKKEYEKENNLIYDVVIKIRTDIIFRENRRLIDDLNYYNQSEDEKRVFIESVSPPLVKNFNFMNEVYFFSTSENMDKISKFYDHVMIHYKNTGTFDSIHNFLIENNITPLDYSNYTRISENTGFVILRPECLEHIHSFIECQNCEKYYYG